MSNLKKTLKPMHDKDLDHAHASGLMTMAANSSASRMMMFFSNLTQFNQIEDAEPALLTTQYVNPLALSSPISYKKSEKNVVITNKIVKNKYNYVLVTYDKRRDYYDIVKRVEATNLGESYGFRHNNDFIDSLEIGDPVKSGDVYYKSTGYDDEMNYGYGKNFNKMYTLNLRNLEDSITVTDDVALDSNKVVEIEAILPDNMAPLNLHGDENEYKSFPNVGEMTKEGIVFGTRLTAEKWDIIKMTNSKLREVMDGDVVSVTYQDYKVIDIEIFANSTPDKLPKKKAYNQIREEYENIMRYRKELQKALINVTESGSDYSTELSDELMNLNEYLDETQPLGDANNKILSKYIIKFTLIHRDHIVIGSKLIGRYGDKGIVGYIENPDEATYFINARGIEEKVQVKFDGLGVLGRLIPGAPYELEINWMVGQYLDRVYDDRKEYIRRCVEVLSILNPEQAEEFVNFYNSYDKKGKKLIYKSIQKEGLPIFISPSKGVNLVQYEALVDLIQPKKYKLYKYAEDGTKRYYHREMIVGKSYVIILKHTPYSKFSMRSRGSVNPRNSTPTRSNKHLKGQLMYSDTACRIGEMETTILLYCNQPDAVIFLMSIYSHSIENRKQSAHYLYENPLGSGEEMILSEYRNKNIDIMNNQMNSIGLNLKYTFETPKEYAQRVIYMEKKLKEIEDDENKVQNLDVLKRKLSGF